MPPKQIELLLAKVAQDEYVLDRFLTDSDAPIEVFGFHAQQVADLYRPFSTAMCVV